MAIKLIANYSKRLGLPGYSSHQFSVSVETELSTADNIATERFGKGVRLLNKVEASGLIDELLDTYGGNSRPHGNNGTNNRRNGSAYRGGANGGREAA